MYITDGMIGIIDFEYISLDINDPINNGRGVIVNKAPCEMHRRIDAREKHCYMGKILI